MFEKPRDSVPQTSPDKSQSAPYPVGAKVVPDSFTETAKGFTLRIPSLDSALTPENTQSRIKYDPVDLKEIMTPRRAGDLLAVVNVLVKYAHEHRRFLSALRADGDFDETLTVYDLNNADCIDIHNRGSGLAASLREYRERGTCVLPGSIAYGLIQLSEKLETVQLAREHAHESNIAKQLEELNQAPFRIQAVVKPIIFVARIISFPLKHLSERIYLGTLREFRENLQAHFDEQSQ